MDPAFLAATMGRLLLGVPMTLELTVSCVLLGMVLALALTLLRRASGIGSLFVQAYVFVFRGSPLLLQLFLIYYGLGQFPGLRRTFLWTFLREPYWCALLALALNTAAYGSEILRGGLAAVPRGSLEAGRVVGMSNVTLYRRIVLPLAIRQAIPAYGSEIVIMVKSTSLASIVTLMEITGIARSIISETFRAIEVFLCAGLLYLAITFAVTRAIAALEWWLSPHLRARA